MTPTAALTLLDGFCVNFVHIFSTQIHLSFYSLLSCSYTSTDLVTPHPTYNPPYPESNIMERIPFPYLNRHCKKYMFPNANVFYSFIRFVSRLGCGILVWKSYSVFGIQFPYLIYFEIAQLLSFFLKFDVLFKVFQLHL